MTNRSIGSRTSDRQITRQDFALKPDFGSHQRAIHKRTNSIVLWDALLHRRIELVELYGAMVH